MQRRNFLQATLATGVLALNPAAKGLSSHLEPASAAKPKPLEMGLVIQPAKAPEEIIRRVHELGFPTCFMLLDEYIGKFTREKADLLGDLLTRYSVRATAVEVVDPGPLVWNFLQGPSTIGLVPRKTRAARSEALVGASDFAKMLGIAQVQTHCGFIPEDPADPLYGETVETIRTLAKHCAGNGQHFLMETGQETPTTMSRMIRDVNEPNLGVGLDTANLILYGKANPVDAAGILGPHVKSIHAKDGKWPTNPSELGEEVAIGKGLVDFKQVFSKLKQAGYSGAVSIEREIYDSQQQIVDVRNEKIYLERILREV